MHTLLVMRFALTLLVLLLGDGGALPPAPSAAQVYTLAVTIHDVRGRGLAGITIIVRDEDGHELTRMVSDADGAASFAALPAVVRVAVEGQARGGPRLYQLGDDAAGVRLDLGQADGLPRLTLRVERDGLVLPDPATMLSLEEGGPLVERAPLPTAAIATPAPLPAAGASTGVVAIGQPTPPAERRDSWVPLVTVLLIAVAAGVMLLVQRRRDAR
ncbi:MAG: carboxypeptidase regulatory-like domain-containing protein [Chloroflexales bacterium]|nr:carboxypeptidase regulatory-like domain-containing protein [Chloroflexales bacterium]